MWTLNTNVRGWTQYTLNRDDVFVTPYARALWNVYCSRTNVLIWDISGHVSCFVAFRINPQGYPNGKTHVLKTKSRLCRAVLRTKINGTRWFSVECGSCNGEIFTTMIWTWSYFISTTLLHSAERLCFYTRLSFCPQGVSGPVHAGIHTPWADTPLGRPPPGQTPPPRQTPPSRRLLLRTVRILLECIVFFWFYPWIPRYAQDLSIHLPQYSDF